MLLLALATACGPTPDNGGGGGGNENGGGDYVAPEVPETPVTANLFRVDYFTTLESEGSYFVGRDAGVASQFISTQEAPRSVVYMFDRCDFTVGSKQPAVQMALDNKAFCYFLQTGPTEEQTTRGTAAVSRYQTSSVVGVYEEDLHLSGITFNVGLSKPTALTLYTARFDTTEQVAKAVEQKEAIEKWLAANFEGYRVAFAGSEGTPYDVVVLCPALMVCRSIEPLKTINLTYWKVTMEKFF
ncbi:MAG: hypothetical protein IKM41_05430 [Tidjanibacter sp.]|nr:hypothetical protein [Tidjanibacter sp.]